MKRVFALMLAVLLAVVLAVPAYAFDVKSPTQGGVPTIRVLSDFVDEYGNPVGDGCEVVLKITPYQDKDEAYSSVITQSLERAYDSYKNDFGTDARAILNKADPTGNWNTKYPGWELRVVNIFDITLLCERGTHNSDYGVLLDTHGNHRVSMELTDSDASNNFVALLHYYDNNHNYEGEDDGEWELIPTTQQGNTISFSVKCSNLSPFALVVKTRSGEGGGTGGGGGSTVPTSPQTGELSNSGYWISCGLFFAVAGVTAICRGRKEKRYAR